MKCHVPSCALRKMSCFVMRAVSAGLSARASFQAAARASAAGAGLAAGSASGAGRGRLRSSAPPSRQRAGRASLFCARFACGRGRVSAPARFAHLIARARRRTHLSRLLTPGVFRPQPVAFCRNAERRPRKPPLSTFIIHHTAKCQAPLGTKNETSGYFSRNAGGAEARIDAPFLVPRPLFVTPAPEPGPSLDPGGSFSG